MATTRKQGADNPNQDAIADSAHNQQNNHAQTPDQAAANHGAFAQSSYQNTQRAGGQTPGAGAAGSTSSSESSGNVLDTAVQTGKKWLDDSGVLNKAAQLPQAAKQWGTKALDSVNALSTTQKVVGGTLLLAGVAYLSTRGKSKSKSKSQSKSDDRDYRAGGKSEGYRQGSWAGYAGGKSASARNSAAGSRSDVLSYGTERRAAGGSQGSSYGRNAGSADTDFGSGSSNANRGGASRTSSMGTTGTEGRGQSSNQASNQGSGNYRSGSSYNGGRSSGSSAASPSSMGKTGSSANRISPNSNEEDYDTSF